MPARPIQYSLVLMLLFLAASASAASPDYTVSLIDPSIKVLRGETAEPVVRVDFMEGFSTSGITLQVPEAPAGAASFTPTPLMRKGGSLLRIDTVGITPGVYVWHVQATAPGSAPRSVRFTIEVTTAAELEFYTFDSSYNKVSLSSLSLSAQGVTDIYLAGRDAAGCQLRAGTPISLASGDPSILAVYPHPDGHYRVYAIDNGSTVLTASTPDGYSESIPVSINMPAEPRITSISVSPSVVTNRGDEMITFSTTGTCSLNSVAYDGLTLVNDTGYWYDDARSYIGTGYVPEGLAPGSYAYVFRAGIVSTSTAVRVVPLTVVNDPARGEIRGAVYPLVSDGPISASGRLELYDSAGVLIDQRDADKEFNISYLQPGTYKLRFVPSDQRLGPQWWPNAGDFESASDVVVSSGSTVEGICFFPSPPDEIEPPTVVLTSPADGEVGLEVTASITAVFSRPMNPSTLSSATFRVTGGQGIPVPGSVTCSDGTTAVFTPFTPLDNGTTYDCVVTTGASDPEGLQLAEDYVWRFSTAADAHLLSEAESLADGVSVSLAGKAVHLHQGVFAYAGETDRSSGIRLEGALSNAADGSVVSLRGVMATTPGSERYIDVRSLTVTGSHDTKPLGTTVRALKSRMMDGLSVRVWGRISAPPTADAFVLSDGSDSQGVTVITPTPHGLGQGRLVSVTGAAGWENGRVVYAEVVSEP